MLSEKGKTEYIYRCRDYELKDYSKIEKFCNSFIDISIKDKESGIFDFDNIFSKTNINFQIILYVLFYPFHKLYR